VARAIFNDTARYPLPNREVPGGVTGNLVVPLAERDSILRVEPVYGLTGGLTQETGTVQYAVQVLDSTSSPHGWLINGTNHPYKDWADTRRLDGADPRGMVLAPLRRRRHEPIHDVEPSGEGHDPPRDRRDEWLRPKERPAASRTS